MTGQFLDTDDRKQAFFILTRLPKEARIRFLMWCCQQSKVPVRIDRNSGEPRDVWGDMMDLAVHPYAVSLQVMFAKLDQLAVAGAIQGPPKLILPS